MLLLALWLAACGEEPETTPVAPPPAEPAPKAAPSAPAPPPKARAPEASARAPRAAPAKGRELAPMPATVSRATELKTEPLLDAKTLAPLAAGTAITVLARNGGWYRVARGNEQGWVRLLHVSTQAGARGIGEQELESAARIATGRQGSGNIANTTGIRGLTPEQLRRAEPDLEALERLEAGGASVEDARAYARAQGLERREIPFLPETE